MSRNRKPTTIAATIAQFRDQAPPRIRENATAMKYLMKFFENGVLSGVALVRDIENLPATERDAATEALRVEFGNAILMNLLHAINDLVDNAESPQARSGQRRANEGPLHTPFGTDHAKGFVPADSADGTPESTAYEELLAKLAMSHSPQESPQAREIVKGTKREIVPGKGEAS